METYPLGYFLYTRSLLFVKIRSLAIEYVINISAYLVELLILHFYNGHLGCYEKILSFSHLQLHGQHIPAYCYILRIKCCLRTGKILLLNNIHKETIDVIAHFINITTTTNLPIIDIYLNQYTKIMTS